MVDLTSKALEECTTISNMVCMLCKTGEKGVIAVTGPSSPFMVGYRPRPVLPGSSSDPASPFDHHSSNNTVMITTLSRSDTRDTASM